VQAQFQPEVYKHSAGRRAFDLAGITNTVGAPFLRVFCEGRESEMPASLSCWRCGGAFAILPRSQAIRIRICLVEVDHQPVEPFDEGFNIRLALLSPAKQIANCVLNFRVSFSIVSSVSSPSSTAAYWPRTGAALQA
jgi:hypothetical protein